MKRKHHGATSDIAKGHIVKKSSTKSSSKYCKKSRASNRVKLSDDKEEEKTPELLELIDTESIPIKKLFDKESI